MTSSFSYKMFIKRHLLKIYRCIYSSAKSRTMVFLASNSKIPQMIWYNVIFESVFVGWRVNACKYMFVYIYYIPLLNYQSFLYWRKLC